MYIDKRFCKLQLTHFIKNVRSKRIGIHVYIFFSRKTYTYINSGLLNYINDLMTVLLAQFADFVIQQTIFQVDVVNELSKLEEKSTVRTIKCKLLLLPK